MYINAVNELMGFLDRDDVTEPSLSEFLATHTFRVLSVNGLFMCEVADGSTVRNVATYGITSAWESFPLDESLPITDALRENRMVWLSDMVEMERQYPALAGYTRHSPTGTVVCMPMERFGSLVGGMGFFSPEVLFPNPTTAAFIKAVTGLVALKLYLIHSEREAHTLGVYDRLTDRQVQILVRISRGDTNAQIADLIGYSESTVRQETMRLFDILGVENRKQAREWYLGHKPLFAPTVPTRQ